MAPEGKPGVEAVFERVVPGIDQAGSCYGPRLGFELSERRAVPELQRLVEPVGRLFCLSGVEQVAPLAGQLEHPHAVYILGLDLQDVAGIQRDEHAGRRPWRTVGLEDASQLGHVRLRRGGGGRRWGVAPQEIHDSVDGKHSARFDQEDGEQLALNVAQVEHAAVQLRPQFSQVPEQEAMWVGRVRRAV